MANLNEALIEQIKKKVDKESYDIAQAYYNKNKNSVVYNKKLTDKELLKYKTVYSNKELDFVINNYKTKFNTNELLKNCLYLLKEFKDTKQVSKCNAIYKILNKYFSINNCYDDPYSRYPEWIGFELVEFIKCPKALKETIEEKVILIKADKIKAQKNKTKEIIAELEDFITLS